MTHYESAEIINVGVGKDISIRELAEIVREVVEYTGEIRFDISKPDGPPKKLLDVSRLEAFGWKARLSLPEGIKSTYHWFLENQEKF
ncbi:GDP-L-fucose synthetase [Beggiatoa sp. PS]|nr:GDP-L-fucose synthetase [Beggiatoa sp. PS]